MDDLRRRRYGWLMSDTLRFTIHYSDGGDGWIMAQVQESCRIVADLYHVPIRGTVVLCSSRLTSSSCWL